MKKNLLLKVALPVALNYVFILDDQKTLFNSRGSFFTKESFQYITVFLE